MEIIISLFNFFNFCINRGCSNQYNIIKQYSWNKFRILNFSMVSEPIVFFGDRWPAYHTVFIIYQKISPELENGIRLMPLTPLFQPWRLNTNNGVSIIISMFSITKHKTKQRIRYRLTKGKPIFPLLSYFCLTLFS